MQKNSAACFMQKPDKQFYYSLLRQEQLIQTKPEIDIVNQAVQMYRKCVEYFDSLQDPIKYYFLEKIQTALSETKTLMLIMNTKNDIAEQSMRKPPKISFTAEKKLTNEIDQIQIKKARVQQVNLMIKINNEAEQQSLNVQNMVNNYADERENLEKKLKEDLDSQQNNIDARLMKRRMTQRNMTVSHSMQQLT
ncbi:unnamed protein product (macronuclear) [Paramecium tetraurelia]|uniref:Uncharacterized protein n=1 Tax=Paramecium tetraurelia TaxID=5888 RepID=A0CUX3_PARTE|nr:uncharacterized protein GSPATT00010758001 [Paramecium tetraurelia]CAK74590.1 unnamed protein product [Paramecium tetraurelia]|eukprot:XP_001441987.1 hypothetical protein (macronuclear) [Paramecium tetraurelia strain d4-2]